MLVNWGVDLEAFRVPSEQERAELKTQLGLSTAPVVFSPRGLKELYNPDVVVGAFARVREAVPGAQLVLKHLGSAETVPPEWRELPGVTLVGHVDREAMAGLFRAADVTVSVPSTDSSPRSVWEAMAAGSTAGPLRSALGARAGRRRPRCSRRGAPGGDGRCGDRKRCFATKGYVVGWSRPRGRSSSAIATAKSSSNV